jgi:glucosamine--fructose-6-phosphate aminotransferase (isomerizing)
MCGIDAVMGRNAIIKALLITLGQLERGTKGTGVAYISNNKIKIVKEPTHPLTFFTKYFDVLNNQSDVAISHNRAPSQGIVSYENTHPFLACDKSFALIHNGTSWNNDERQYLAKLGHKFQGQTDSEVLMHILEEYYLATNDYVEALQKLVNYNLSGAIIILTKEGEIYATKRGYEPLNYVKVNGEVYLASVPQAIANIIKGTKDYQIVRVKSKQIVRVRSNRKIEVIGEGEEDYTAYGLGKLFGNWEYSYNNKNKKEEEEKDDFVEQLRRKRRQTIYYFDPATNEWYEYP